VRNKLRRPARKKRNRIDPELVICHTLRQSCKRAVEIQKGNLAEAEMNREVPAEGERFFLSP